MNNVNKLIKLIEEGVDPNTIVDGETILNKLIKLIEEGVDPNTIVNGETIFIRSIDMPTLTSRNPIIRILLDRGVDPDSLSRSSGRCTLEVCAREDELILMRYGATKYNCDEEYRVARRINRVLIICDMMLYMDDGVPSDWIREIKECLY